MEDNNLTFLQVIRLEDVELWQAKGEESHCRTRSFLQVLYSNVADLFILRVGEFKWLLDKSTEVIGTVSGNEKYHTYLLPDHYGFFLIKIIGSDAKIPIANFETILENTVSFMRKGDLEGKLGSYKHQEKSKDTILEGIMDMADNLKKAFSPSHESHPNQTIIRNFDELKDVNSQGTFVVDISKDEIQRLWDEGEELGRKHSRNKHWKGFKEARTIAGTGLASQSFGENETQDFGSEMEPQEGCDNIDTRKTRSQKDQQEIVGTENQRLPSYEVHSTKDSVMRGFRKASQNLGNPTLTDGKNKIDDEDEEEFTIGLLRGPGPEASTRSTAIDMSKQTAGVSETWSNTSNPSRSPNRAELSRLPPNNKDLVPFSDPNNMMVGAFGESGNIPPQA